MVSSFVRLYETHVQLSVVSEGKAMPASSGQLATRRQGSVL